MVEDEVLGVAAGVAAEGVVGGREEGDLAVQERLVEAIDLEDAGELV